MLDESYARVKEIFFTATDLEPGERASFLARVRRHDRALSIEVGSLLRCWQEEPHFLDRASQSPSPQALRPMMPQRLLVGWERYSLEECVGVGASSLVYRATDRRSKCTVAIKLLSRLDAASVAQFRREGKFHTRIAHESVLEIYSMGSVEGIPFLALKWVNGPSLMATRNTTSLTEKVEMMRKIAQGLHAAHERGIVHLDVKPANILVERSKGGELPRGNLKPYLADFGIARESGAVAPMTGALLGTPSYVAPERLLTAEDVADHRSDVYALGVTFYQFLIGHTPYPASSPLETLRMIRDGEIPLPRDVMPSLPAELEAILMMCLASEPARRYPSALALAKDLERFLIGLPIMARGVGRLARAWHKTRNMRNSARVAMVTAIADLLCEGVQVAPERRGS